MGGPSPARVRGGRSLSATVGQARELRNARLESLRAIGALSVLCGHTLLVSIPGRPEYTLENRLLTAGGELVYLFFVLSGCLLYTPFARLLGSGGEGRRVDLKRYFVNRAVRLLPLYYVTCAVLYAFPPLDALSARLEDWWRFALFLQFTSEETAGRLNGVLWTLVVEFHFYLLLPVLAFAVAKLSRGSIGRAAAIVGALALASFALRTDRMLTDVIEPTDPFGRNALPSLFFYMAGGMFVALLRAHVVATGRRLPGTTGQWLAVGVVLWLAAIGVRDFDPLTWLAAVVTVGACVLPLGGTGGVLARALEFRPLVLVGVVSYSLYLWHGAVILWIADPGPDGLLVPRDFLWLLAVGLAASLVVAAVSYRLIERPVLQLRRRWGPTAAAQIPTAGSPAASRSGSAPRSARSAGNGAAPAATPSAGTASAAPPRASRGGP